MDSKRVLRTEYDFKGLNRDDRSIYYYREDGTVEQRIGGDRAWRNNNPGNIRWKDGAKYPWNYAERHGAVGIDGDDFAIFPDWETGLRAKKELLLTESYGSLSLSESMKRWASDKKDNPEDYARFLASRAGVSTETKIEDLSQAQLEAVFDAIGQREGARPGKTVEHGKDANPSKLLQEGRLNDMTDYEEEDIYLAFGPSP